ncbi:hypothetical protein [Haloarchaeobius sp. DYHT-AS-18]|uniref:hypothetical protein n=1 Tax=Haloarchaeobius sp. DYHT-AS-18 TaxID=3446117 RepID=UPI003EB8240B
MASRRSSCGVSASLSSQSSTRASQHSPQGEWFSVGVLEDVLADGAATVDGHATAGSRPATGQLRDGPAATALKKTAKDTERSE